jgi:hypothetical protein
MSLFRQTAVAAAIALTSLSSQAIVISYSFGGVADSVTDLGNGSFAYSYTVEGWGQAFVDPGKVVTFAVPYFADALITSIASPSGWSWAIDSSDRFELGHGAQTLVWSTTEAGIASGWSKLGFMEPTPAAQLSGFGYTAAYSPVKGPFETTTSQGYSYVGDPALPGSPDALASGLTSSLPVITAAVPEPQTYALMLLGLGVIGATARRTRQRSALPA